MPAPEIIHRLVEQFRRNRATYTSQKYNETLLRQEFLNPFFKTLGWDVDNEKGFALQYREVIHEDRVDVDGSTKAPDYAFRIGGVRKFFVEAKKPAEDIEGDANLAYQLRRYAWNAHLPVSILTDFEEFAVYDCRNKPNPGDSPATSRIMLLRYADYEDQWDEIAAVFSPEAILMGAFDRYAEDNTGKRGTIKVDDAFLADIEEWRTLLARNIALRNPQVSDERQLNFAVQMIIDRIIFLRISEDRKIEPENQLREISGQEGIYPALVSLFERADLRYNSGLFHFKKEKGRTDSVDTLTPALDIDDKVLKGIIKDLYFPSPYIFNEIPVEILGQVYEQFLGKVIRLTAGHRAKVEEKPEVRKAGGVYYTPKYIVDYIVEHTVGKLLEGKTPKEAAKLKIVDPACGSGSFLLGAFQYLLNWHEGWYLDHDPAQWAEAADAALSPGEDGGWRISTAEKKRILLNNIFGVDIDAQAVEVTKLSLLLKVLEGETGQLRLGFERVLPDLGANIQCGNSLIGPDYYEGRQLGLFNEEEMYRINAFDWERAFPEVFAQGGFDAVIGNPPYVRQEMLGADKEYFHSHYIVFENMADLYSYFVEKGMDILNKSGYFSFIVANKWMRANYGTSIRKWLKQFTIEEIIDFKDLPVFSTAKTYPCIIRLTKKKNHSKTRATIVDSLQFSSLTDYVNKCSFIIDQSILDDNAWTLISNNEQKLLGKIKSTGITLEEFIDGKMYWGLKTGYNKAFVVDAKTRFDLVSKDPKSDELIKPYIFGRGIKRYQSPDESHYLILIPRGWTNERHQKSRTAYEWFKKEYFAIAEYLEPFMDACIRRTDQGDYWWEIRSCNYYQAFVETKIFFSEIALRGQFGIDISGKYYFDATSYIISSDSKYLLGVLNSKLYTYYISHISSEIRGNYLRWKRQYLLPSPIPLLEKDNSKDVQQINKMVSMVETILDLNKRIKDTRTPSEITQLQRQIDATDAEIDRLVYELYGLTAEEIRIVEESVK